MRQWMRTGVMMTVVIAASQHANAASHHHFRHRQLAYGAARHVLQCVAFARADSDVVLPGNAVNWWQNAKGVYARGTVPEVASVLNFRANPRMRLGHVAVVTRVVDSRTIQIDQSHWNANGISRNVTVVDVSSNNDWSAVRVAIGHHGTFGSIYPTFGFIYPRADTSGRIITARSDAAIPQTDNAAPSDLRAHISEVAEASDGDGRAGLDLTPGLSAPGLSTDDAPNRSLR